MKKFFGNPTQDPQYAIEVPFDGKKMKLSDPAAIRAWIAVMDMYAVLGGAASHFGGPSALVELLSALHAWMFEKASEKKIQWNELYHFVNDAGHCENVFYAMKANYKLAGLDFNALKKFRSIESPLTGHGEVHCFPEGIFMSNGPLGSAFPQSQGLAMADRKLGNQRTTICILSDGACMEGEAKEALAAIPGLAQKNQINPYLLVLSDNNTKLSGRIDQDSFSMQPTFASLKPLGWKVVTLENPHNLEACLRAYKECFESLEKNPQQPIVLHAKTIKGYGVKKTANSASGGHGFPLKKAAEMTDFLTEIFAPKELSAEFVNLVEDLKKVECSVQVNETGEKIQIGISKAMIRAKKDGIPVISITSDLPGSTGVAGFRKEFPGESYDVGVAEANMISTAAGFSKMGFVPVVDTFAQFGVTKGALPLTMANLSESPVIAVFSHTGFQDAADGASHQALSYLAMTCSLPYTNVISLSCSEEADVLLYEALKSFHEAKTAGKIPPSFVFFLGRENFPKNYAPGVTYQLWKSQILYNSTQDFSNRVALYASGSLVGEALKTAEILKGQQIGCVVIHPSTMNPFDLNTLNEVLRLTNGNVATMDDHQTSGGLASILALSATYGKNKINLIPCGVDGEFGRSSYQAIELYQKHHLDAKSVAEKIRRLF